MPAKVSLRRLWQPPARYADRATERHVTFLELFFDLVFVVVVAQLAERLAEHPTWPGVGWFVFLFYAVWSSWANGTLYHDLHTTDDLSIRVFTFAQMLSVAVMAAFIAEVPGEGSAGFAVAYAANVAILAMLWFRTGVHDPDHRAASIPYASGYLLAAVVFAVSAPMNAPTRTWLWGAALVCEIAGTLIGFYRWKPPIERHGDPVIPTSPSLIERLGLFVIIVLGEVVFGAVTGMTSITPRDLDAVVIGLLGVLIAIGLWMIYFDFASHEAPVPERTQLWLYLHLPLVTAIAAGGAAVLNTIEHARDPLPDPVRWLLVGSLATAMATVACIAGTLQIARAQREVYWPATTVIGVSAVICLGVGLTGWGAKGVLIAMSGLLVLPIASGIAIWLRYTDDDVVEFG